jgi:hypothetical protein
MENNQQESKAVNDKNQNQDQQSSKQPKQEYHFSKTLGVLILLILLPIVFWKIKYPSYTYRYKMTVEVETPQGIKSGSSVVEVHTYQIPQSWAGIFGGHHSWMKIKGEGVFVEIEEGKTLFVLLGGDVNHVSAHRFMSIIFPVPSNPFRKDSDAHASYNVSSREGMRYYGTLKNVKSTLPKDKHLAMISAIKSNDGHREFKVIEPEQLKEIFRKDIKIKQIIIETTNDPLEWKIRKLPMWNEIQKYVSDSLKNREQWFVFSADSI